MGVILGSGVVPIALCITWSKANKWGCIIGSLAGFAAGIIAWLVTTSTLNNGVVSVLVGLRFSTLQLEQSWYVISDQWGWLWDVGGKSRVHRCWGHHRNGFVVYGLLHKRCQCVKLTRIQNCSGQKTTTGKAHVQSILLHPRGTLTIRWRHLMKL